MSDTFTFSPTFLHRFRADDAAATAGFSWPKGIAGQGFMVGEDGNHYFMEWPFTIPSTANMASLGCVETGTHLIITGTRFATDYGAAMGAEKVRVPIPGTKYFWAIGVTPGGFSVIGFQYQMVLYKIVNSTTVTAVRVHTVETTGLQSMVDDDVVFMGYNPFTETVRLMTIIKNSNVISGNSYAWCDLAATEDTGVTAFDNWHYVENFDEKFFDFAFHVQNGVHNMAGFMSQVYEGDVQNALFYVDWAGAQAIVASPAHSDGWTSLDTTPAVYKLSFASAFSTDVDGQGFRLDGAITTTLFLHGTNDGFTQLGFTVPADAGFNKSNVFNSPPSGSADRPVDDYTNIVGYTFHGTNYVILIRSYVSNADLGATGTYVKYHIYTWDGTDLTLKSDGEGSIFNMVSDAGGSNPSPPNSLAIGLVGDDLYYIFMWPNISSVQNYIVGRLVTGVHAPDPRFHAYFSAFRDNGYQDWRSVSATNFSAHFDTWYAMQDDSALWMEAPWIITYVAHTDDLGSDHDELLMTPKWEWTDDVASHRWGATQNVYRAGPAANRGTVLDTRHRVRGKGRALQLHFESTGVHPFNLFGWSIDIDRNAQS